MSKTKVQLSAPSPKNRDLKASTEVGETNTTSLFVGLALDMSWRLALIVLVPILGGYEIDRHWHTTPLLTIVGIIIAMIGVPLVLRQTLNKVNSLPPIPKRKRA
jgi:F0F1-type ATP synthase assembly protein I